MSPRPTPESLALQARIRELVADRPVRATYAYRTLRAEGWTAGQIERARRKAARTSGTTRGAWWSALPPRPPKAQKRPAPLAQLQALIHKLAAAESTIAALLSRSIGRRQPPGAGPGQPRRGRLWCPRGHYRGPSGECLECRERRLA